MHTQDTIAAIATAPGTAAIAVIRLSGPASLEIADRLFRCAAPPPSRRPGGTFVYGKVLGSEGILDECLLLIFRAPKSYTREEVVEIQCHGGQESARRILRRVLECGARSAEPGEFTRRAFLNGRLDLVQAEAVMDLIGAQSARAASSAVEQLAGRLSETMRGIYDRVIHAAADLEATLDFPEEDFPDDLALQSMQAVRNTVDALDELLATWEEGHRLREGALVVISGRPNAGKSTLLNRLLGRERAIVSPVPGTTRDILEETFVLNGLPIRLVDTAGLRETGCAIEKEGIARAQACIEKADIRLHLVDASIPFSTTDLASIRESKPKQTFVLMNKTDLCSVVNASKYDGYEILTMSLKDGTGLQALHTALANALDRHPQRAPHATISERHFQLLFQARSALSSALDLEETISGEGLVPAAAHLREAAELLGRLTGRTYYNDMLDQIFSRFCIGK
ncbi:MAG: tRNA uridine-5-carboxymethylaminomethyl(34) synthesis GTPase MnmE [Kiritimatiellia bacterium]